MVSKGRPSPPSAVKPLSDERVQWLAERHKMVNSTYPFPTGVQQPNEREIQEQNPRATKMLLDAISWVLRTRAKVYTWGLEHVPAEGVFITAASHVTMFDVFVPMTALFHMGRRPRYMAKAELAHWPILGKWFRTVGMQSVPRRSGQARAIESESVRILTNGRPLTIWPEGTVTRDPLKWPMSMKNGVGMIALQASRQIGFQIPLFVAATWGAASIRHWWPWPRKNVVMCYDEVLDYGDLLEHCEQWGEYPPQELADELTLRVHRRMEDLMSEIRGEEPPLEGYWDYRTMSRLPRP